MHKKIRIPVRISFAWLPCIAALADCHDVMLINCAMKTHVCRCQEHHRVAFEVFKLKSKVKKRFCARFCKASRVKKLLDIFLHWRSKSLTLWTIEAAWVKVHYWPYSFLRMDQWCIWLMRLTVVCERTWCHFAQVRQNLSEWRKSNWCDFIHWCIFSHCDAQTHKNTF